MVRNTVRVRISLSLRMLSLYASSSQLVASPHMTLQNVSTSQKLCPAGLLQVSRRRFLEAQENPLNRRSYEDDELAGLQ